MLAQVANETPSLEFVTAPHRWPLDCQSRCTRRERFCCLQLQEYELCNKNCHRWTEHRKSDWVLSMGCNLHCILLTVRRIKYHHYFCENIYSISNVPRSIYLFLVYLTICLIYLYVFPVSQKYTPEPPGLINTRRNRLREMSVNTLGGRSAE